MSALLENKSHMVCLTLFPIDEVYMLTQRTPYKLQNMPFLSFLYIFRFQNKIYLLNKILPIRKLNKNYKAIINVNAGLCVKHFNYKKKKLYTHFKERYLKQNK